MIITSIRIGPFAMLPDRFQDTDERLFELEKKLAKCKNYRRTEKSA